MAVEQTAHNKILSKLRQRQAELAHEREEAAQLLQILKERSREHQLLLVNNSQIFVSWGFCEAVLEESWNCRFDDVAQTVHFATLGVAVAARLESERYTLSLINDMRGRAWAHLGNGLRIQSDYVEAEKALSVAEGFLRQGSGDPLEEARLLGMKAALLSVKEDHHQAIAVLDRAARVYSRAGDTSAVAFCLVQQGMAFGRSGDVKTAIRLTERALDLTEPEENPRWYLTAQHNLIILFEMDGQPEKALESLGKMVPLYSTLGDRLNLTRLRFLEGRLCASLGHDAQAEAAFLDARQGFLNQGIGPGAAEVSLELALLYSRQGRTQQLRPLASQMVAIFRLHDMPRHVNAALSLFQEATEKESVGQDFIQSLLDYLEKARETRGPVLALF